MLMLHRPLQKKRLIEEVARRRRQPEGSELAQDRYFALVLMNDPPKELMRNRLRSLCYNQLRLSSM